MSGNYITLQPGDGEIEDTFVGEDKSPITKVNEGDLLIHLVADELGSIVIGSSIYFKEIPVGKIYDYHLSNEKNKIEIDVVIDKAYAQFVKQDSRFWNISGISADIGLSGINVDIASLGAIVQGAVAFDSPENSLPAEEKARYKLYADLDSAKRNTEIAITLTDITGLNAGKTAVYVHDNQIGVLSSLKPVQNKENLFQGTLLVNSDAAELFKANTNIVLRNKKPNLGDLSDIQKILRGKYFDILPGTGDKTNHFNVIKENEILLKQPNTMVLELTAPESYGITEGQQIYYNNLVIGDIITKIEEPNDVRFKIAIAAPFRHLIRPDTLFIAASNFEVNLTAEGLNFEAATPEKWLLGGIRVISGYRSGKPLTSYPLYSNLSNAEAGITQVQNIPSITLKATQLSGISKNSTLLYHQYEVGKILDIRPKHNIFEVDVFVYPKYRHLLTNKSLFWLESATKVNINSQGVNLEASPLSRVLKGAISFDNSGSGNDHNLYPNQFLAKSAKQVIMLEAKSAVNLSEGMPLRYKGLKIGEVSNIKLSNKNGISIKAIIDPKYITTIAREGSKFSVISPQVSAGSIEHLDTLLQPYIDINIGNGKPTHNFKLEQQLATATRYADGFPLILEATNAMNISENAPVLYRGLEVGTIKKLELNKLGDRVLIHILIDQQYKNLVRQNSEFWISSGYGMEVGFSGVSINTGTMQQLLKGGISFSTPSSKVIQPIAKAHQRFLLQIKRPNEAESWNSGVLNNATESKKL